jgi:ferredoxin
VYTEYDDEEEEEDDEDEEEAEEEEVSSTPKTHTFPSYPAVMNTALCIGCGRMIPHRPEWTSE